MSLRELPEINLSESVQCLSFDAPEDAIDAFDSGIVARDDANNTINIFGEIGRNPFSDVDNSERRISAALRSIGDSDITVNVNSPGGSFFSGLAIYNLLAAHPAKVTVNILGLAGSAGSVIAMAGDEITLGRGSKIMIHKASALVAGNSFDMRDAIETLGQIDAAMSDIYAARTGADRSQVDAWMRAKRGGGTFFSADAAVEAGFADSISDSAPARGSQQAKVNVPTEKVAERSLMASGMSARDAKSVVAQLKTGARDAATGRARDDAATTARDDSLTAALTQLSKTIRA